MSIKRKILSLNRMLNQQRSFSIWQGLKANAEYQIVTEFSYKKALVLSPHPDDETLGCGGLIERFNRSTDFDVVYFFSGDGKADSDVARLRQEEAARARETIKIKDQLFLPNADGSNINASSFTEYLSDRKYEAIFCPNPVDPHDDHRQVAEVLAKSMTNLDNKKVEIWTYEIWNPLPFFNRLVEIDWGKKRQAIEAYKSQLKQRDYVEAMAGLNQYRGSMMGLSQPAEAFMMLPCSVFCRLFDI